jgi:hypothetical protein
MDARTAPARRDGEHRNDDEPHAFTIARAA